MSTQITVGDSYLGLFDGRVNDQFVLVEGKRGTGKTRALLTLLVTKALKHPGSRWLILRSTRTRLTDSAVATFVDQVLPLFGLPIPTCQRPQLRTYVFPNKSEFIFQALDDPDRQQSVEICGAYVVEGVEIPELMTITALAGSMRQVVEPPVDVYQCIVDCNPDAPTHPLNVVAEDADDDLRLIKGRPGYVRLLEYNQRACRQPGRWKRIITQHYDNPAYFNVKTWDWTTLGKSYLATLSWLQGNLLQQWLYGLWVAAEGSVFGGYFSKENIVPAFRVPASWPLWFYLDPGFDHPCGGFWVTVGPTGRRYVVEELYQRKKDVSQIAQLIREKEELMGWSVKKRFMDPRMGFSHTFYSRNGRSIAEEFELEELKFDEWPRLQGPSKDAGVNSVRRALASKELLIFQNCANAQGEFQSWAYKRNAKGERLEGDERYQDSHNHLIDGILGMEITGHVYEFARPEAKNWTTANAEDWNDLKAKAPEIIY